MVRWTWDATDWEESIIHTFEKITSLQSENARLRKALQDIIHHHEIMGGQLSRFSAIRLIAQNALNPLASAPMAEPDDCKSKPDESLTKANGAKE